VSAPSRKRIAVLASGRGSNLGALIAAAADPQWPGEIALVLSDHREAGALSIARDAGIAAYAFPRADFASRADHEAAFTREIEAISADFVVLAGYMRVLSAGFVRHFEGRLVNIHPSLLPSFRGLDTHARALAAGVRIHGCSVHFVSEGVDEGAIIAQAAVPVLPGDSEGELAARVLAAEHRLYPLALGALCRRDVRLADGRAVWRGEHEAGPALFAPFPGVSAGKSA
jgi:phosphoribosylglycinamide formyltransferase-1